MAWQRLRAGGITGCTPREGLTGVRAVPCIRGVQSLLTASLLLLGTAGAWAAPPAHSPSDVPGFRMGQGTPYGRVPGVRGVGFTNPVSAEQMRDRLIPVVPAGVAITSVARFGSAQQTSLFEGLAWDDGTTQLVMPDGIFLTSGRIPPLANTSSFFSSN